jgi:D-glycero-alpha-D-manno-heptose-7-phosphate kinase
MMIISKTPLRISLFGGGTDLPIYSNTYGGQVVSFTINKYVYIMLNKRFDKGFRISYSKTENIYKVKDIKHPIVRNALFKYNLESGIEIVSLADVPGQGSGLGSSSSFTVGLINSIQTYLGVRSKKHELAQDACDIEINMLGGSAGRQDQYASAYGGLNSIVFNSDESVNVEKISISKTNSQKLKKSMMLFYTKKTRAADKLLSEQTFNTVNSPSVKNNLHQIKAICSESLIHIQKANIEKLGALLDLSWSLKKTLSSKVSSDEIDYNYKVALKYGAFGGKLLGAGGGGFMLLLAPPEKHRLIESKLGNWQKFDFDFDHSGSKIISSK